MLLEADAQQVVLEEARVGLLRERRAGLHGSRQAEHGQPEALTSLQLAPHHLGERGFHVVLSVQLGLDLLKRHVCEHAAVVRPCTTIMRQEISRVWKRVGGLIAPLESRACA